MRGQTFHNHLVYKVANILTSAGWSANKEFPIKLPNGSTNYVDIYAEKSGKTILIEVETTTRNMMSNIEKAYALNLPLWIVFPNRKTLNAGKRKYNCTSKPPRSPPVIFLLLSHLTAKEREFFPV